MKAWVIYDKESFIYLELVVPITKIHFDTFTICVYYNEGGITLLQKGSKGLAWKKRLIIKNH